MAEGFTKQALKMVVSQICQTIGWHAIQTTSLEVLIDVLHRYLEEIAKTAHLYADQFGRTRTNLDDLGLAFCAMGIEVKELEEYVEYVESVPSNFQVPKYPAAKDSHLNFLKPGSKEVVTRPVHVHEHLPPTVLETEEEYAGSGPTAAAEAVGPSSSSSSLSPQASPQGVFKRPGDPVETPAAKRARLLLEEEGKPLREISSVMMTTGGFLSPAREGKLPEPKVVLPTSDSRSISPQPSSYPTVPPEVNREKKLKKLQEISRLEKKEKKKLLDVASEGSDDSAIKKLASVKETEKLKALKTGALKMASRGVHLPNKVSKPSVNKILVQEQVPEKSLIQKLSESPHLVVTPVQPTTKKLSPPAYEKSRDPGVTIAKLTTEPDSQKLNIFKKITKVKEEKLEKHDFADIVPPINRERSPGLIIEEVTNRRPRTVLVDKPEILPPKERKEIRQPKPEPRTPDMSQIYEDTLSSPGSPTTPKTPEIFRKMEKSPEHKRKKKDKEKKKRKSLPKERVKMEDDVEKSERPKTPEMPETPRLRDPMPSPVLSFFPHFPSGPGLIPPPISNPLIPRFPHPLCPNFPNLPLPPSILMQHPIKPEEIKRDPFDKISERSHFGSFSPVKSEKEGKSPLAILLNRDKEKKFKEHKKKDRDKIKKKKDKKEKIKKEKGEKKHKDEKYKEHRSKEKKEKKIKKKEKSKEATASMVVSVPKLTLKLGPSSPRPPSPDPKLKKLLSKPSKMEEEEKTVAPPTREPTPELARISSLFNKPAKTSLTKPLHVQTESPKPAGVYIREVAPVMKSPGTIIDKDGNKVWICPACGRPDDGSAMIGCDECDAWYHWVCVGIQVPPDKNEDWYCRFCIVKKQGSHTEKRKRGRKKKPPV